MLPMPKVALDNTCFEFPIFNMNIPDQYRATGSRRMSKAGLFSGKQPFPSFINIAICNDHGTSPKPEKGYPYSRRGWPIMTWR